MPARYRQLDSERLIETVSRLRDRIRRSFPDANLGLVAEELLVVARDAANRSLAIRRPNVWLRALSLVLVVASAAILLIGVVSLHPRLDDEWSWADVIQTLEASLGALFFLSAAILSALTIEARRKRRRCLDALHELRAMAHIVDMHQLTKDPEGFDEASAAVRRPMSRLELVRYLDYCSEMLALMGKLAALYVQDFPDPQAVTAVDEVEELTTGLSRKIWQKIMILDARLDTEGRV